MNSIVKEYRAKAIDFIFKILYKIKPRYAQDVIYYHTYKKRMDLENPKDLIEKIHYLLYKTDTSMWTLCADKYRMREYVASKGLEDYLPKLYGHWEDPEMIDFSTLPDEFVLKSNNGCGTVMIVHDKTQLDMVATKKLLKSWLKPYGYFGGQTHYLKIKPCIIAEELLHQSEDQRVFSPYSLVDYKMWCFNGEPESIWVAYNRHDALMVNMALYDKEWNPIPQHLNNTKLEKYDPHVSIPKPNCLEDMLCIANKLAEPFPEVRVDFYVVNGKPVIGELTFTTGYGYFTHEYYKYLGSKVDLSDIKEI